MRLLIFLLFLGTKASAQNDTVKAQYPGGSIAFSRYLMRNLTNDFYSKGAPPGTYVVRISYVIDTAGYLVNIQPQNDPGYGTQQEAVRVMSRSGRWVPAKINGKKIESAGNQTITFEVLPTDNKKHDSSYWKVQIDSNTHQLYRRAMHVNNTKVDSVLAIEKIFGSKVLTIIQDTSIKTRDDKYVLVRKIKEEENTSIKEMLTQEQYIIWVQLVDHTYHFWKQ